MIGRIKGWTKQAGDNATLLTPPEGTSLGWIQMVERVSPIRDVSELVREQLSHPGLVIEHISPPETIVTREGEYATLVVATGTYHGRPVQRDLGYVMGDDFYTCMASVVLDPAHFGRFTETMWHMLNTCTLELGVRSRPFLYTPPTNWYARTFGHEVTFTAPAGMSRIIIWPALPACLGSPRSEAHRTLGGDEITIAHQDGPAPVTARSGLTGSAWEAVGRFTDGSPSFRRLVILEDERYLYRMRLDVNLRGNVGESRARFDEVVRSTLPIPGSVSPFRRPTSQAGSFPQLSK